ncbi:hypothetical protein [Alicyclobacillus mengziensis]|uniref:Uncharacterized protein n=1 Tax=Alicyclobacillus mengziensis TaxID=2931921 RepID=A0A9X7W0U6_9BACL|nr:hypothetical protein [Alicyclobacillus mengziensis]QSO47243.1 hypothetical protein JZ786_23085 [Alicyclobacillus mengziensis]
MKYHIPLSIRPGEYRLDIVLRQESGDELSTNRYTIVISEPAPASYDGPAAALDG